MKLAEIQQRLLQGLPPGAPPERQDAACALLDPDGSLEPAQRLSIYRRNISGALLAALEAIYPVCRQVLGEGNFAALARDFAWRHPSRRPDLNRYGEALPEFLGTALQLADRPRPHWSTYPTWRAWNGFGTGSTSAPMTRPSTSRASPRHPASTPSASVFSSVTPWGC